MVKDMSKYKPAIILCDNPDGANLKKGEEVLAYVRSKYMVRVHDPDFPETGDWAVSPNQIKFLSD